MPDSFGAWLKRRRKARDLTQAELARQAGCAAITLRKIEAGELRPSRELGARLVTLLAESSAEADSALRAARRSPAGEGRPARYTSAGIVPSALSPLVGRDNDVASLCTLLQRGARLITLTGPGGVGKTRVALAVAERHADGYPGGVWFVSLAPVREPELVAGAVLATLDVIAEQGVAPAAQIAHVFRQRRALLLLDNFEQVLGAAPLVTEILAAASSLAVLVTSRAVLGLAGEQEWGVRPLAIPPLDSRATPEAIGESPAVSLFIERARAIRPEFQLTADDAASVAAICRRLDGLPLAIELAAARTRLFSPTALLERLEHHGALDTLSAGPRGAPARQRTLRDTLRWSYTLLSPEAQGVFQRLAAFSGDWSLDAAANVCEVSHGQITDLVGALVEHGMVSARAAADAVRFFLLETVREFALEQLVASGGAGAARRRHAQHYLALAESLSQDLHWGARQGAALARVAAEIHNMRAALAWSLEPSADSLQPSIAVGLRLSGALWPYWLWRGSLIEGAAWFERLLRRSDEAPSGAQASGRYGAGGLLGFIDTDQAIAHCRRSVELYDSLGDTLGAARARHFLGRALFNQGDAAAAAPALLDALATFRERAMPEDMTWACLALGDCARLARDIPQAERWFREALELSGRVGDVMGRGYALVCLGRTAHDAGQLARSRALLEAGIAVLEPLGAPGGPYGIMVSLAAVLIELGEHNRAAMLLRDALTYWWEVGSLVHVPALAEGLGAIALAQGRPERAARLYAGAGAMRQAIARPRAPDEQRAYERDVARCRALLAGEAFGLAWEAGERTLPQQLVAEALAT